MSTINAFNPKIDQTVHVFDNFYDFDARVPAAEYDVVLSYFQSIFTSREAAENFTTTIFRIAQETNTGALTVLQGFEGQSQLELNVTLAYYLNQLRSPATLLGVLEQVSPNYYTARNVRQ